MNAYNEAGQNVKLEKVRYIILGKRNLDSEIRELKNLCRNVYWIHVEEVPFFAIHLAAVACNVDIIK